MGRKPGKKGLTEHFPDKSQITTDDIHKFFASFKPEIGRATVNWRIHDLVAHGHLTRIGRGLFVLNRKPNFQWEVDKKQHKIYQSIKKRMPFARICCWQSSVINEFFQHIPNNDALIVEAEKDTVSAVYSMLKESYKSTFKEPDHLIMQEIILDSSAPIIVKTMVTEAPLERKKKINVPTLEKILVDLVADTEMFYFLQGHELQTIYENAFSKYIIIMDRLFRYARRRSADHRVHALVSDLPKNFFL